METKKVLGIIFSILFICAFGFVLSWGIINFNKVKDGMSGTGVYTKDDVDKAYKDGYSTALDNEKSYTELIDSYRDTITAQTDQISQLNSQVTVLTNSNKDYTQQIINLESQKVSLEEQVDNLSTIKTNNETTINDLTSQIVILQKEVSDLQNSNYNYSQEIAQKNSQISNLQNSVLQLQKTNELNVETINNLNSQITNLNSQISEMSLQIQNNSANVSYLNNKISELEQSVSYYERYISSLENGEQVVATFEFNGSVYSIQIVAPNSTLSVTNPTSTDYVIFNYWTVAGDKIDLSTYKITKNTKIVADVTQKYDVKFMVDNTEFNKQLVVKNGNVVLPSNPTKNGYEFDGWTINGVDIIDPTTINVNSNTTFIAKFTKLYNVTFMSDNSLYSTEVVRSGNYVTIPENPTKSGGYTFVGWTINGDTLIDLSTKTILSDIVFTAKFEMLVIDLDGNNLFNYSTYETIVFDYYTNNNEYFVNGVNIIDNSEVVQLTANDKYSVDKYVVNNNVYILSNCKIQLTDIRKMFYQCKNLKSIEFNNFDTTNVIYANSMFYGCESLTELDLSNFVTNNFKHLSAMFYNCKSLIELDLSNFNCSVEGMNSMFYNCNNLESITFGNIDTSSVTQFQSMFYQCYKLTSLDLSFMDTSNAIDMNSMFYSCSSLIELDLINFNTSKTVNMYYLFCYRPQIRNINSFKIFAITK